MGYGTESRARKLIQNQTATESNAPNPFFFKGPGACCSWKNLPLLLRVADVLKAQETLVFVDGGEVTGILPFLVRLFTVGHRYGRISTRHDDGNVANEREDFGGHRYCLFSGGR